MAQCCSTDYILSRLNITEVNYLDGLREELRERFQAFNELAERLRQCELILQCIEFEVQQITCLHRSKSS